MELLPRYSDCFFCGREGDGPHLRMSVDNGVIFSEFVLDSKFQGYARVAHAGIVTGVLDEAMWWAVFFDTHSFYFTTKMEIDLLRPVYTGTQHKVTARVIEKDGRAVRVQASIRNADDKECARVLGTFKQGRGIDRAAFAKKLDFVDISPQLKQKLQSALED